MLHVTHGLPRKICRYMSIMIEHAMAPRKRMRNKQIDCSLPVHRDSHSVSHERELYLTTHAALRSMYSCVLSKAPPPGALGVTLNVTTCTQGPTSSRCLSREKSVAVLRSHATDSQRSYHTRLDAPQRECSSPRPSAGSVPASDGYLYLTRSRGCHRPLAI